MKVDILLASYNGEKYIAKQIESILNQTHQDFNLIIQDDHSSDHTVEIIKNYASCDERITYYINSENLGYIKNFESLLKISKSEYIMLCDQDDVWLPEKVEKSISHLINTHSDLIYGDLIVTDENLNKSKRSFWASEDIKPVKGNCWKSLSVYNVATGCTMLFNRKFLDKILPFPESPLIHDWWITFIYAYFGKINFLKEPLILYRQHGNNAIGLTNDYYDNTQDKIVDYLSSTKNFMHHREKIISRNLKASSSLLHFCQNKFPKDKELLTYLKNNFKFFNNVKKSKLFYFRQFRFGIYKSRGKIGYLVLIVLNFPIVLYILNPIFKLLKKR